MWRCWRSFVACAESCCCVATRSSGWFCWSPTHYFFGWLLGVLFERGQNTLLVSSDISRPCLRRTKRRKYRYTAFSPISTSESASVGFRHWCGLDLSLPPIQRTTIGTCMYLRLSGHWFCSSFSHLSIASFALANLSAECVSTYTCHHKIACRQKRSASALGATRCSFAFPPRTMTFFLPLPEPSSSLLPLLT